MDQRYPFPVEPLPYSFVSLMPRCDADTLYYHYGHYVSAVRRLNRLADRYGLTGSTLNQLLFDELPVPTAVENNFRDTAGEVYNHRLYFRSLYSPVNRVPDNSLTRAIAAAYGSLEELSRLAAQAARSVYGSGWLWLIVEGGDLHLSVTKDNHTPDLRAVTPVLCADLWEHAYWTRHQFDRRAYLQDWFSLLNWEEADSRYQGAET